MLKSFKFILRIFLIIFSLESCQNCEKDISNNALLIPDSLKINENNLVLSVRGIGTQNYELQIDNLDTNKTKWTFLQPEALLFDNNYNIVGWHSKGPIWWYNSDSSWVKARAVYNVKSPNSYNIDWLKLSNTENSNSGLFSKVKYIQRLYTESGVPQFLPSKDSLGFVLKVPYTCIYNFYQ